MHIGSGTGTLNEQVVDFEWDAVPIPYAPTGKSICQIHGLGNTIAKSTKVADAAFTWVSYLGSFAGSGVLGNSDTVIPSRSDTAPLWFNPTFNPKNRSLFLKWTDKSMYSPNTAEPTTAQWSKFITDELTLVMEEGKDVQQAMDDAKKAIDDVLAGKASSFVATTGRGLNGPRRYALGGALMASASVTRRTLRDRWQAMSSGERRENFGVGCWPLPGSSAFWGSPWCRWSRRYTSA